MVFAINAKADKFKTFLAAAKAFKEPVPKLNTTAITNSTVPGWNGTAIANSTAAKVNTTTVKGKRDEKMPVRLYGRGAVRRWWWSS
jgi:hypothetical protein